MKSSRTRINGCTKDQKLLITFCTASINRQLSLSRFIKASIVNKIPIQIIDFCFKSALPVTERQWVDNALSCCSKASIVINNLFIQIQISGIKHHYPNPKALLITLSKNMVLPKLTKCDTREKILKRNSPKVSQKFAL